MKNLVAVLLTAMCFSATADALKDARLKQVDSLYSKYPCEKYETPFDKQGCEWGKKALLLDKTLALPDDQWSAMLKMNSDGLSDSMNEQNRTKKKITPKIGMTKEKIYKDVLGAPDSINDTLNSSGETSQWVYRGEDQTLYLYFGSDGKLKSMQRHK